MRNYKDVLGVLGKRHTEVWYSVCSGGDGAQQLVWFLTEDEAKKGMFDEDDDMWVSCVGRTETYCGSNVHKEAIENSESIRTTNAQLV